MIRSQMFHQKFGRNWKRACREDSARLDLRRHQGLLTGPWDPPPSPYSRNQQQIEWRFFNCTTTARHASSSTRIGGASASRKKRKLSARKTAASPTLASSSKENKKKANKKAKKQQKSFLSIDGREVRDAKDFSAKNLGIEYRVGGASPDITGARSRVRKRGIYQEVTLPVEASVSTFPRCRRMNCGADTPRSSSPSFQRP